MLILMLAGLAAFGAKEPSFLFPNVATGLEAPYTEVFRVAHWPAPERVAAAWPMSAQGLTRESRVQLQCTAELNGHLSGCTVVGEDPPGLGLGAVAMSLSTLIGVDVPLASGGGDVAVRIPLYFQPPDPARGEVGRVTPFPAPLTLHTVTSPTTAALRAAWPATAKDMSQPGVAVFSCRVTPDDRLSSCMSLLEDPKGTGLAEAALGVLEGWRIHATVSPYAPAGAPPPTSLVPVYFWPASLAPGGQPTAGLVPAPVSQGDINHLDPNERVEWVSRPSGDDLGRYFPKRALRLEKTGRTMTTCRITEDGSLEACRPDFAIPEGYGFAEAALKIMPFFRVRAPKGADGKTVSPLTVHVPVRWTLSQ